MPFTIINDNDDDDYDIRFLSDSAQLYIRIVEDVRIQRIELLAQAAAVRRRCCSDLRPMPSVMQCISWSPEKQPKRLVTTDLRSQL